MIQAMYNGVSGLRAHKTQMDVISNNIANVNTVGFKSSRVNFQEMFSQTIRGASAPKDDGLGGTNPAQIGLGASIGSIDVSQSQGSLQPTGKNTDMAIEGNGFFILGDGQAKFYSRDGSFTLDSAGNLVSAGTGLQVLGWMADASGAVYSTAPVTPSSAIRLPIGQMSIAKQTSQLTLGGNLDSKMAVGVSTSVTAEIYDSLGKAHTMAIEFTKEAGDGEWSWEATAPDAAVGVPVGSGIVNFNSSGGCITGGDSIALTLAASNGAVNPLAVGLDFNSVTQLSGDTTVSPTHQNGLPLGMLDSFTVGKDGIVSGMFTNGMSETVGQIALAQFSNPAGMSKVGNNLLNESGNSGLPQVGEPALGSMGKVVSGFLESSNVDLPTEFANMIVSQRGFQANSRIITTADEILQELVQLKR